MNSKLRIALLLPLVGLLATWSLFLTANYFELPTRGGYNDPGLRWEVYL